MSLLKEANQCVSELSDEAIDYQIKFFERRKYNICEKMESGVYSPEQADKNYKRAADLYNVFYQEKNRRLQEKDKYIKQALDGMKGMSLGHI